MTNLGVASKIISAVLENKFYFSTGQVPSNVGLLGTEFSFTLPKYLAEVDNYLIIFFHHYLFIPFLYFDCL